MRIPNKVDPTQRISQFGVQKMIQGEQKSNLRNVNSEQSGPHLEEFRVRSLEKRSCAQYWKCPISEIRAKWKEIQKPTSITKADWRMEIHSWYQTKKTNQKTAGDVGHDPTTFVCSRIKFDGEAFARETEIERRETLAVSSGQGSWRFQLWLSAHNHL